MACRFGIAWPQAIGQHLGMRRPRPTELYGC